jgi:dihydrofolate reductase
MNYELIVAMSKNGVIGNNNKLPWYIPEDLVNFSELTKGHIIIMGRKTFESLPNGPLKNRLNVVLSRTIYNNNNNFDENVLFTTMDYLNTILKLHQKHNQKIFIIGGSEIYNIFIEDCNKLHIRYSTCF